VDAGSIPAASTISWSDVSAGGFAIVRPPNTSDLSRRLEEGCPRRTTTIPWLLVETDHGR